MVSGLLKGLAFAKFDVGTAFESPSTELRFFLRFLLYKLAGNFPGSNLVMVRDYISTTGLVTSSLKDVQVRRSISKLMHLPVFQLPTLERPQQVGALPFVSILSRLGAPEVSPSTIRIAYGTHRGNAVPLSGQYISNVQLIAVVRGFSQHL